MNYSKSLTLLVMLSITSSLLSQEINNHALLTKADSLFRLSKYKVSTTLYESFLNNNSGRKLPKVAYKTAVAFANMNNPKKAVFWLQNAIDNDIDDDYLTKVRFDINFYPIKHTREWQSFIEFNLKTFDEDAKKIEYPEFRNELLDLWKSDQYYRQLIFGRYNGRPPRALGNVTEAVDRFNTGRLEEIVEEIGWSTHSKVGNDGAHAAWNIIQHAVFNPPFMKICLDKMKEELERKEVDGVDYAYLNDRYQAVCNIGKIDYGIVRGVSIRNEFEIDERRKSVGFKQTMMEYQEHYTPISKTQYDAAEKKLKLDYETFINQGKHYITKDSIQKAAESYSKALESYGYVLTEDIYTYARLLALLDTPRSKFNAIKMIRSLAARGYNDVKKIKEDEAFKNIINDNNFIEIIQIIEKYNSKSE